MINIIAKLLKVLNSETAPWQISAGFCLAMIAGLTPLWSPHNLVVLLLILMLRVNLTAALLGWGLFSAIAWMLDPFFHALGYACLTAPALKSLWTWLYNIPWLRLTGFYNSLVLGSLLAATTLFFPLLLLLNFLIRRYRDHWLTWVQKSRIAEIVKSTRVFSAYKSLSERGLI